MNLKIQKFAEGGTSSSAFFYQPLAMATTGVSASDMTSKKDTTAKKSSTSDTDKGKFTDKDLIGLLKDIDGLPSDILSLYQQAQNFWADPTMADSNFGTSNYSSLAQLLIRTSLQAKIAKFNKEVWDKSRDTMYKNGAENEMAITDNGGILVQDKDGGIQTISINQWKKNPYSYKTLTNQDVLELRAQKLPKDNSILNIVNGSVSMQSVTDKLMGILSKTQSNSSSSYLSSDGFNTEPGLNVLKGLAQRGVDPRNLTMAGVYKYTTKDNAQQVANLVQYAWASLSTKEKTLLEARAGKDGKGANKLLELLAIGNTGYETSIDYEDQLNPDGTKKETSKNKDGKSSSDKTWDEELHSNPLYALQNSIGGELTTFSFRPDNGNATMTVYGSRWGDVKNLKDNTTIPSTSLSNFLMQSGIQGIANVRNIYFGDKLIDDPAKLQDIIYLNEGAMRVNLPITVDSLGNKKPDFTLLPRYEQAMKEVRTIPTENITYDQYLIKEAAILKKYGLNELIGHDGMPNKDKFGAFIIVNGQAEEEAVGVPSIAQTLPDSSDAAHDAMATILYPDGKGGGDTSKLKGRHWYPFGWGNSNIYKAPIYIAIDNNPASTLILSGNATPELLGQAQSKYIASKTINSGSKDLL